MTELIPDAALIERCRDRDADAFRILVERYKKQAYGFAFSYLKNVDDSYSVSQEAFVRAWNGISAFRDGGVFRPWLFSIVKRLALNHIRKKKRLREISLEQAIEESGCAFPDNSSNPQEYVEADETRRDVWKAVMGLKEEFREIIVLKHFHDLSYHEISESLDIPEGTVMSRLYHARKALKKHLESRFPKGMIMND